MSKQRIPIYKSVGRVVFHINGKGSIFKLCVQEQTNNSKETHLVFLPIQDSYYSAWNQDKKTYKTSALRVTRWSGVVFCCGCAIHRKNAAAQYRSRCLGLKIAVTLIGLFGVAVQCLATLIMISIVKHTFCHVNPRLINPHRVLIGYHFQSLRNRLRRSPNHPVLPQKCVHFTTRIWGWPAKKWNSRWKMMTNHERCWCSDRSQIAHAVDIFVQRDLSCRHVVDPLRVAHRQTLCIRRDLPLSKDSK